MSWWVSHPSTSPFAGRSTPTCATAGWKVLAVMGNERMQSWPDVPTVGELGYKDAAVDPWNAVLAPSGTPPEVVDRLARELASILRQDDMRSRLAPMGLEPAIVSPERFGIEIRELTNRWPIVVKAIDLRSQ